MLHFYLILWTHVILIFEYINVDIAYKSLNLKSNILAHLKSLSTDYFFLKYRSHIALCSISDFWLEIRHDRWYIAAILILYFSKDLMFWLSKQLTSLDSNCKPHFPCGVQQAMFLQCPFGLPSLLYQRGSTNSALCLYKLVISQGWARMGSPLWFFSLLDKEFQVVLLVLCSILRYFEAEGYTSNLYSFSFLLLELCSVVIKEENIRLTGKVFYKSILEESILLWSV